MVSLWWEGGRTASIIVQVGQCGDGAHWGIVAQPDMIVLAGREANQCLHKCRIYAIIKIHMMFFER